MSWNELRFIYRKEMINMMKKIKLSYLFFYFATIMVVVLGDQLTKLLVTSSLRLTSSFTIIENFFYFTYMQNRGAAWGLFEGQLALLLGTACVSTFIFAYYFLHTSKEEELTRYGMILIFAGMIGNVIDRISLGYVRDFIDFLIFGYDFPVFNIADCAVVIGVGLILFEMWIIDFSTRKNKIKENEDEIDYKMC